MNCHFHPEQVSSRTCKKCTRGICNECANLDTDMLVLCPLCWGVEVKSRRIAKIGRLMMYLAIGTVAYFGIDRFILKYIGAIQYYTTPVYLKVWMAYCVLTIFLGWPLVERFKLLSWIKPFPNFIPSSAVMNRAAQASVIGFFYGPYAIGKTVYDIFTAGRKYKAFG